MVLPATLSDTSAGGAACRAGGVQEPGCTPPPSSEFTHPSFAHSHGAKPGANLRPRALTVIQVQLVQLLRLSLDRYGSGGQTLITVLTHLGQRQRPGGCGLFFRNLRQLVLLVAHPGWAGWAAGLQTGRLLGTGWQCSRGAVGTECWLATRGTAAAQLWTHLWLQQGGGRLLGGAGVHAHRPRHLGAGEGPRGRPLESEGAVAWAGHALAVGGGGQVVQLGAGAGRRRHHGAPLEAGREAGHEAGARVRRQGQLLAVAGLGERAQALAHWSAGQGRLVVIGGLCFYGWNCEEKKKKKNTRYTHTRLQRGARGRAVARTPSEDKQRRD